MWTFGVYLFVVCYAIILFLLCAPLFPDSMQDYKGYEDYFLSKRAWLFGVLASAYLLDVVDTLLKGEEHFALYGNVYFVRTPLLVILCLAAIATDNRMFHGVFVAFALLYQASWIWRLFDTLA